MEVEVDGITYVLKRGFVAEVRAPLAVLVGGACGCCDGSGYHLARNLMTDCPECNGTGRTGGVLPALVKSHPIERVTATDKEPYWNGRGHSWFRQGRTRPNPVIPVSAELPLLVYINVDPANNRYTGFETDVSAITALSDALLSYARSAEYERVK